MKTNSSILSRSLIKTLFICSSLLVTVPSFANDTSASNTDTSATNSEQIKDLDQLLRTVRDQQKTERRHNQEREQRFLKNKSQQQALLKKAKREFAKQQTRNNPLLNVTQAKSAKIKSLRAELEQQRRDLGDIYSIYNEFVTDFGTAFTLSLTSAEFRQRQQQYETLKQSERLATIEDMESLWLLVQEEMTATGKVSQFDSPVIDADGSIELRSVLRLGPFTAISLNSEGEGRFLRFVSQTAELLELNRQPSGQHLKQARDFANSNGQQVLPVMIDPSQGTLLGVLTHTPTTSERIEQGGMIALIILGLGALGLSLTLWRLLYLSNIKRQMDKQLSNLDQPSDNNPLGRIMLSTLEAKPTNSDASTNNENLQYKLDEAILAELPKLERSHSFIKLLAVTSPLLGLLGTVTGMILTFQAISLYGSGDPKLMASGISQALITTVVGLVAAIPLLFGHNLVSSLSGAMIQRLDEQSAGIMAKRIEQNQGEQN